ncbi:hypothetical protein [Dactylosporangium sp. NPDC051484]|uniref:hypothetical protein n=1 Tax=Dactylosporangium sp. NPDC051484 TaxID=3154942 RepID=UPI00344CCD8F
MTSAVKGPLTWSYTRRQRPLRLVGTADEGLEGDQRPNVEAKLARSDEVTTVFPDRVFGFDELRAA